MFKHLKFTQGTPLGHFCYLWSHVTSHY
uniref:Uncharacterized protein n=1 Tax=Rhizophora mucronata TaxID=61149 RepID=A0A2P2QS28_RHIMU